MKKTQPMYFIFAKRSLKHLLITSFVLVMMTSDEAYSDSSCLRLDEIMQKITSSKHVWKNTVDFDIKGSSITRGYEREAIKRFFESHYSTDPSQDYGFTIKQDDCKKVTITFKDEQEEVYKITSGSKYHIELTPENPNLKSHFFSGESPATLSRIRYMVRRYESHTILEKIAYLQYSIPSKCSFDKSEEHAALDRQTASEEEQTQKSKLESHAVEVKEIISWNKAVKMRRFISEKLLQLALELTNDYSGNHNERFIACEMLPPIRTLTSE